MDEVQAGWELPKEALSLAPGSKAKRALDGEPRWVLMAGDPLSSGLVRLWAYLEAKQYELAHGVFLRLVAVADPFMPGDQQAIDAAIECADRMWEWRQNQTRIV